MPLVARKDQVDTVNTIHVSVGDADPLDGIACDANPVYILYSSTLKNSSETKKRHNKRYLHGLKF